MPARQLVNLPSLFERSCAYRDGTVIVLILEALMQALFRHGHSTSAFIHHVYYVG